MIQKSRVAATEIDRRLRSLDKLSAVPIRSIRREYTRIIADWSADDVIQLALELVRFDEFPHRLIAYELVRDHRPARESLNAELLEQLGDGLDSWEDVDTFACYVAGPAWRQRRVGDKVVRDWAHSPDRWRRRLALASTIALNNKARGGSGDSERTLMVCAWLLDDRDDMVVKAMSWALRELAKRDAGSVQEFIDRHEDRLAARALREVRHKLRTGLKNPRRRPLSRR